MQANVNWCHKLREGQTKCEELTELHYGAKEASEEAGPNSGATFYWITVLAQQTANV